MDKNSLTYIALRDALTRLDLSVVQDLISDVVMRGSKKATVVIDFEYDLYHTPTILHFDYTSLEDLATQLISNARLLEHPLLLDMFDLHDDIFTNFLEDEKKEMIVTLMNERYHENKLLILQDFNDKNHGSYTVKIFYGPEIVGIDFWTKVAGYRYN